MTRQAIGTRATAILSANEDVIHLLGHGIYEGEQVSKDWPIPNPCIKLDSGAKVYGYQCWWGPEDRVLPEMQRRFPKAKIVDAAQESPHD